MELREMINKINTNEKAITMASKMLATTKYEFKQVVEIVYNIFYRK